MPLRVWTSPRSAQPVSPLLRKDYFWFACGTDALVSRCRASTSLAGAEYKSESCDLAGGALQQFGTRRRSSSRQNASAYLPEADAVAVAFAPAGDDECIAVFEPFAGLAIGQL